MQKGTWGIVLALAAATALLVAARIWMIPHYHSLAWWIVGIGIIGSMIILLPIVKRKERTKEALHTLDRISGDQIGTALTYLGDTTPIALKQREEAMRFIDTELMTGLRQNVPLPSIRKPSIPFAALGIFFIFLMFSQNPMDELRQKQLAEAEWLMERTEQLEQLVEQLSKEDGENERIMSILRDLEQQFEQANAVDEAMHRMDLAMNQLGRLANQPLTEEEQRFILDVAEHLETIGTAKNNEELALQNGKNVRLTYSLSSLSAQNQFAQNSAVPLDVDQWNGDAGGDSSAEHSENVNADNRGNDPSGDREQGAIAEGSGSSTDSTTTSSRSGADNSGNPDHSENLNDSNRSNGSESDGNTNHIGSGNSENDRSGRNQSGNQGSTGSRGEHMSNDGVGNAGNGESGIGRGQSGNAAGLSSGSRTLVTTPHTVEGDSIIEYDGGPLSGDGGRIEYGGDAVVWQNRPHDYEAVYDEYEAEAQHVIEQNQWPLTMRERIQAYFDRINPDTTRR